MAQPSQPPAQKTSLFDDIQSEVRPENAPLLQFITKYAGFIAGAVLILLLILGGMGIYRWQHGAKQKETREELSKIDMQLKGADKEKALSKLAENAPDSIKLFIYMNLGQCAQENGNPILAADAYAKAAKLDGDGSLGLAAALGSAGSLAMQGEYAQAIALLQELEAKLPLAAQSIQLKQMLAEVANNAGNRELAIQTYKQLARETKTPEAEYFQSRADALQK